MYQTLAVVFILSVSVSGARSARAADWCADVRHQPPAPRSHQAVTITASVSAAVKDVQLQYQVVDPGHYIEIKDPAYSKQWTPTPMKPTGPAVNGSAVYTVTLPGDVQQHRRLVRYRVAATSADGKPLLSPEVDPKLLADPKTAIDLPTPPNYAYFVYDGIPAWKGAIKPGSGTPDRAKVVTFPPDVMNAVQAYHLLGTKRSIEAVTWKEQVGDSQYRYTGTLVVDGVVHDHVRFRARGGVWRYAMGKNQWKIDLPDRVKLAARDDFGKPYAVPWGKVNLRGIIQMGDYGRRGEQGLYESVGFRLFNLAGVPAPYTHYIQFRVIHSAEESPENQYDGDFWGLYLAIEDADGRFLKQHDLPDGNLFKMEGGFGALDHQGKDQPADSSDLRAFLDAYNSKDQPEAWWRRELNLPSYYSYRSIVEAIHHYDIAEGKNYNYYKHPRTNQWQVIPWDLDLTWADHMYGNGDEPFNRRVLTKPALQREYQNRLREIRDLLYNAEQTGQLIDEHAAIITAKPGETPLPGGASNGVTLGDADRRKWDHHPALGIGGQAGQGRYYQAADSKDFPGMVKQMKQYVATRSAWIDKELLKEKDLPATPTLKYTGPAGFPAGSLSFEASAYQGKDPFAAMAWRIAEVTPADVQLPRPRPRAYEITPAWESGELAKFDAKATVPASAVKAGKTYRVRVKVKDTAGRWSHWSAPVEFVAGK